MAIWQVDRCVIGLVAQQQTVGPLQLPLADVVVIAQVGLYYSAVYSKGHHVYECDRFGDSTFLFG